MAEGKVTLKVVNFVSEIKKMADREPNKLRASDLIDLIMQVPDLPMHGSQYEELTSKVEGLIVTTQMADSCSVNNVTLLINLEAKNKIISNQNNEMKEEIHQLKSQVNTSKDQFDNIEQYLRINNIEIVRLPPMENQNEEEVILKALNNLDDINITSNDIDICHPIPSKRCDGKSVHVVRFVSRKAKIAILNAKKQSHDFKFKDNIIFTNEPRT